MSLRHGTQYGMGADRGSDRRDRAACLSEDPEIFFCFGSDFGGRTDESAAALEKAKSVCRPCPVKTQCLEWALDHENWGVWGGTSAYERRQILASRAEEAAQGLTLGGTCVNGHERTAETVRVNRAGVEYCLTCHQIRGFNTATAVAAAAATRAAKQKCVNGHELAGDNVYWDAQGHRNCRRCKADRMARTRRDRRTGMSS